MLSAQREKCRKVQSSAEESNGELFGDEDQMDVVEDVFTQARTQVEEELTRAIASSRFNPNPNDEEVKQLRSGYAKLLNEVRAKKNDLVQLESTRLKEMLSEANELLTHVHTTADATLDSRFVALSADITAEKVGKLAAESLDFTINDFCSIARAALIRTTGTTQMVGTAAADPTLGFSGECYNWETIGMFAMRHWLGVSAPDFFLGPITVTPREANRKVRAPRTRQGREDAPLIEPAILDERSAKEGGGGNGGGGGGGGGGTSEETTSKVIDVYQILERVTPLPMYKLITHPTSYSRTVENLFYLSFLVNDNRVRLEYEKEELIVHLMNNEEEEEQYWSRPKHQAIYSMTMSLWRENIAKYKIKTPVLDFL
jgi:hypothetical protein